MVNIPPEPQRPTAPLQGVGLAAQQAGAIGKAMEVSPGYMSILGRLGNGPSPLSNPSPINAAMQGLGVGGAVGGQAQGVQNAPQAPRGAPEALSAAYGSGQQNPYTPYWATLAANFPRSGFGG